MHIEFVHTGTSKLIRSPYPNIFFSRFTVGVVLYWLHCNYILFGLYASKVLFAYMCCYFFYRVHFKRIVRSFECCHIVDYFSALPGIIYVWAVYFHYDVIFLRFFHFLDHIGWHFWCIYVKLVVLVIER